MYTLGNIRQVYNFSDIDARAMTVLSLFFRQNLRRVLARPNEDSLPNNEMPSQVPLPFPSIGSAVDESQLTICRLPPLFATAFPFSARAFAFPFHLECKPALIAEL